MFFPFDHVPAAVTKSIAPVEIIRHGIFVPHIGNHQTGNTGFSKIMVKSKHQTAFFLLRFRSIKHPFAFGGS